MSLLAEGGRVSWPGQDRPAVWGGGATLAASEAAHPTSRGGGCWSGEPKAASPARPRAGLWRLILARVPSGLGGHEGASCLPLLAVEADAVISAPTHHGSGVWTRDPERSVLHALVAHRAGEAQLASPVTRWCPQGALVRGPPDNDLGGSGEDHCRPGGEGWSAPVSGLRAGGPCQ